jgi:hypothetical protein
MEILLCGISIFILFVSDIICCENVRLFGDVVR